MKDYWNFIKINPDSMVPMCRQLADAIVDGLKAGKLVKDDGLPSLHEYSSRLEVSKNTVEKAYNLLKARGIVGSFRGKGHYVLCDEVKH